MDLEGTDGRERGEDDTAFEKQSALFALAVSDIVLINMWCHDIGPEQAANKPLLKTVFQVMMRLFSPRKSILGHLRSGTLDKFKEAFDKALNGNEGFSSAAHCCTQSLISIFDEGCADAVIHQTKWDTSKVRENLLRDIEAHITSSTLL
ncbi:hypothetical protein Drorol1_Dr00013460 [Drosera rotundifolia]